MSWRLNGIIHPDFPLNSPPHRLNNNFVVFRQSGKIPFIKAFAIEWGENRVCININHSPTHPELPWILNYMRRKKIVYHSRSSVRQSELCWAQNLLNATHGSRLLLRDTRMGWKWWVTDEEGFVLVCASCARRKSNKLFH